MWLIDISLARLLPSHENATLYQRQASCLIVMNNRRFVELTTWLRPFTRWATRFSLNSPQWLPAMLRNAPLRMTSLVLRCYHLALR